MTIEDLPRFQVSNIVADAGNVILVGRLVGPIWTDRNWVGCLHIGAGRFIWGRFTSVVEQERTAEFVVEPIYESDFLRGQEYAYLDAYWGEKAELILDTSLKWTRTEFHPSDSLHEHCLICWETIAEPAERFGYLDQNNRWVCESCYEKVHRPQEH